MKRIYSIYCIQGLVQFRITEESSLFVWDQCLLVFEGHLYPWICNLTNLLQRYELSQKLAIYMYWCPIKPVKFWFKYLQLNHCSDHSTVSIARVIPIVLENHVYLSPQMSTHPLRSGSDSAGCPATPWTAWWAGCPGLGSSWPSCGGSPVQPATCSSPHSNKSPQCWQRMSSWCA